MKRYGVALSLTLLLGCSTPPVTSPVAVFNVQQVPPPEFQRDLPLEAPSQSHFCQLGQSCMALDPRPFEACLVGGTKRCADKAAELLLVGDP